MIKGIPLNVPAIGKGHFRVLVVQSANVHDIDNWSYATPKQLQSATHFYNTLHVIT